MPRARPRSKLHNPFVIGLLAEGLHFADREREVARMVEAFTEPGAKLVVYGDRRLGKSSTMERAARDVRRQGGLVAIAAFSTASDPSEAAQRIVTAVQKEVGSSWRELLGKVAEALDVSIEIAPRSEPGALPAVKLGFGVERRAAPARLLPDVLDAINAQMARRRTPLGLGLDEFQRIHEWGGEDAEWALRDAMQRHESLSYVLAGSQRHLIEAMIGTKGRALWKLADAMEFGPMDDRVFADWITARSAASGVPMPPGAADRIVQLGQPRTRDVVQLARVVWDAASAGASGEKDLVDASMDRLVREQGTLYEVIWGTLSARQQMVLRAFAANSEVQVTAAETLRRYQLGAKSTVQSTLDSLIESEHLARAPSSRTVFDDPFFRRWVQLFGLPDIGMDPPALGGR